MTLNSCKSRRREAVDNVTRVVIKVGTRLLTDTAKIPELIHQIAKLRESGSRVILVSSGAVGLGMKVLGESKRPPRLSQVQALASVGQSRLMSLYEDAARECGFHVGQLLLTATGLRDREKHINTLNCVNALLDMGVLPIINENDSVAVDELKFGDNDSLAALVASMTRCELTILLTTVDGLRDVTSTGALGARIPVVERVDDDVKALAGTTDDGNFSIGGMASKLKAAEIATNSGGYLWIADGREMSVISQIFNAEDVGTLFTPVGGKDMPSRKRWLAFFTKVNGSLVLDDGAVRAVTLKGRSLLPAGIIETRGAFPRGSTVRLIDKNGAKIGRGIVNYGSDELNAMKGKKTEEIVALIGYHGDPEAIHRDNLVLRDFM